MGFIHSLMFTDDLLVHPEESVTPIRSRSARRDPTIQLESEGPELKPTSTCTPTASAAPPLTDTGNHVQEVVQALVHRRGDDFHLGEGVGHRVDAQLRHQQRDQDDLILLHLVILHSRQTTQTHVRTRSDLILGPVGVVFS